MFQKPKRKVTKVFIHCSASDNPAHDDINVIKRWHFQRGFADVGYHYFVTSKGERQKGRSLELTPAAQKGHNLNTIAICVHGLEKFSPQSLHELKRLCLEIDNAYNSQITFHGHCEVSNKTCPVFDYKSILSLDEQGYIKYEREPITFKAIPIIRKPNRSEKTFLQKLISLFKFW